MFLVIKNISSQWIDSTDYVKMTLLYDLMVGYNWEGVDLWGEATLLNNGS